MEERIWADDSIGSGERESCGLLVIVTILEGKSRGKCEKEKRIIGAFRKFAVMPVDNSGTDEEMVLMVDKRTLGVVVARVNIVP